MDHAAAGQPASQARMEVFADLDDSTRGAVLALASTAGDADGAYPLSDDAVLRVRHGGGTVAVVHLICGSVGDELAGAHGTDRRPGREVIGYAQVATADPVEDFGAELVVHPMYRNQGHGRSLIEAAIATVRDRRTADRPSGLLRVWAHGDHPSASALAMALGFQPDRTLIRMRRRLGTDLSEPSLPTGVSLRPFQPGGDDAHWLALNAAAFADLPDQGGWTLEDLRARLAEPWFDPSGFLLAERSSDGQLLGSIWTKVHDTIGEVYVVGVAPVAAGEGLGRALTLAGLRHLRERGLSQVMLYVDQANTRAVALYRSLGFARWSTDLSYVLQIT